MPARGRLADACFRGPGGRYFICAGEAGAGADRAGGQRAVRDEDHARRLLRW